MTRWGVWGSLFSFTTIYPEVVERHHNFAYYEAAPRTMYPQRRAFLVPVHRTLSSLGAVTGLGVFWVLELKRDPHVPFLHVQQVHIIRVNSETRHEFNSTEFFCAAMQKHKETANISPQWSHSEVLGSTKDPSLLQHRQFS